MAHTPEQILSILPLLDEHIADDLESETLDFVLIMAEKNKHLDIVGGPNGSGKTTFVHRFLPYYADSINFVNADLIAAGLSPFSPDIAAIKAGKIPLDQIQEHIKAGRDFASETTLEADRNHA